jgi:ADP-heptose:LPS heptosyltransferase
MKFAVIQLGRIGDMVLMTPLFKAIKEHYKDVELTVFAGPSNFSIIENNPYIDNTFVVIKSPIGILKTIFYLLTNKYDYWIDPKDHHSTESRVLARISKSVHKIGFNATGQKKVFDIDLPITKNEYHHTQIGLNSLVPLGYKMPDNPPKPILFTQSESDKYVKSFLESNNLDKFVLLNISGSAEHKMWQNDSWIEFLSKVDIKYNIVICFAPSEESIADYIVSKFPEIRIFKSRNINDIVSLVSKSEYLMTPDTAIVHIAAAFNIPVFALYSGLDNFYNKFHPLSDKYLSVRADEGDYGIKSIKINNTVEKFFEFQTLLKQNN